MNPTVTSSTDTPEQVLAANAAGAPAPVEEVQPPVPETAAPPVEPPAPEGEPEDLDAETPELEGQPNASRGGWKRRADKARRDADEARADRDHWRDLALSQAKKPEAPAALDAPKPAAQTKPKADDFDTQEAYLDARDAWVLAQADAKVEAADRAREARAEQAQAQTEEQKRISTYAERLSAFKATKPDYDAVMDGAGHVSISQTIRNALLKSDVGPQMAYELAKDPDELVRISALPVEDAAMELGALRAKLSGAAIAPKTTLPKSNAPPPIRPVTTSSGGVTKDPNQMTHKEFREWRAKGGGR